jgi:5-methylthioadenosine/S-adenosylhomocysteine deaminase
MNTISFINCRALLGIPPRATREPVDIIIKNRRIAEIRPAGVQPPEGTVIDGTDRLLTPGMINGHNHSHENYQKGRHENMPLEVWSNLMRPLDPWPMTPRQIYIRTMIGAIESLRTGATTIVDDLIVGPILRPDHVEAVLQAYEDIGLRALLAPGMNDKPLFETLPFGREMFPPDIVRSLETQRKTPPSEIMALVRRLAKDRHPKSRRVATAVSPSAPQRCSEAHLMATRRLADDFDLPIVIHVHETRLQVVTGHLFYGAPMVEYLHRIGFLRPGVSLIHVVWLTPREIDFLAETGATAQHNPVSNFSLGSGVCPVRALLKAGVNVSLGTDSCASSFTISMLKTLNAAALANKIRGSDPGEWITAEEAFSAATLNGARAVGLGDDLGAIEVGRKADLTAWRLDSIAFSPLGDPLRQLVYCENGSGLDTAIIDGEIVMRDRRFVRIDEDAILTEARNAYEELKPQIDAAEAGLAPVLAACRKIYDRCLDHKIADDTYPARFP